MTFSRKVTCPCCGALDRVPAERFNDQLSCAACGRALFAARHSGAMTAGDIEAWLEGHFAAA